MTGISGEKMISFKEVHVLDRNSEYYGVPARVLMQNAGNAVAKAAVAGEDIRKKNVLVLCGSGNNGGDGFAAAQALAEMCNVSVVLLKPPEDINTAISREQYEAAMSNQRIRFILAESIDLLAEMGSSDLIIDAMLGIGVHGEVLEPYASAIRALNNTDRPVLSVDVPSGLVTNIAVQPDMTVTFHDLKDGMEEDNCGKITVANIGIPEMAVTHTGPGEFVFYPKPKLDSRKGDNGKLLVIGGGPYTGAPSMAALAAYRTGADLVPIAVPENVSDIIASHSPQFIVKRLPGEKLDQHCINPCLELVDGASAVLIGPGLGDDPETLTAAKEIIRKCSKPMVIDADAIKAVAEDPDIVKGKKGVLTPHMGEFRILAAGVVVGSEAKDASPEEASGMATRLGLTVLLKGREDIIADGRRMKINDFGNAAMTIGGTGDVLAGVVGALLAKGSKPYDAARLGACITGLAGNRAYASLSYGMMATDVINQIPGVLSQHLRN
jgi:NAD(P)H-hydrate epimerase